LPESEFSRQGAKEMRAWLIAALAFSFLQLPEHSSSTNKVTFETPLFAAI
jgi:hypothetical protein